MRKNRSSVIFLFSAWMACTVTSSQAAFIGLGDSLAYDDVTSQVWFTGGFDQNYSMDQINDVLATMSATTTINGSQAQLAWSWASLAQVNTITFTQNDTLAAFGVELGVDDDWHAFSGYCSNSVMNEFGDTEHLSSLRGVYRLSETQLDWWDDYSPFGEADHYNPFLYASGPFWLVADVVALTDDMPLSVPEPSTTLLVMGGLLGLAGLRRRFRSV